MSESRTRSHLVLGASTVLSAIGAVPLTVLHVAGVPTPVLPLPWLALGLAFALAQAVVLDIQLGREARSVSLSEAPFVVGLLALGPAAFLTARVLGGLATQLLVRRQYRSPWKLLFNGALMTAESGVGLAVYVALARHDDVTSPLTWVSAVVGAVAASTLGALAVEWVIVRTEAPDSPYRVSSAAFMAVPQATAVATIGLVTALALQASGWAVVPLTICAGILVTAYRAYAALTERHLTLERLYRFSQVVGSQPETENVLVGLLDQVCDMLHAEVAVVTFFSTPEEQGTVEVVARRGGPLERGAATYLTQDAAWLVAHVAETDQPILLRRGASEPAAVHWLATRGLREALIVPLHGEAGVVGALTVGDRLGDARGYDVADLRLLETVGNHAAVALRNGKLVDKLRHESLHDSLTGLPNRSYLMQEIERLTAALGNGGEPFALGLLDLNSFKEVNDTLGHLLGDQLLCEVAQRLSEAAVGRAVVARLGGDEFALLLSGHRDEAMSACSEVLRSLAEPFHLDGTAIDLGAAMGLALAPDHGTSPTTLLRRADQAMYGAKQSGSEVVVFDPAGDVPSPARLSLAAALRQVVTNEQLEVYVQPKVAVGSGEVRGVEALVRWHDPDRGFVPPDEFIPLAESSGLIRPLTSFVLREAIQACAAWQDTAPGTGVAVNLSARSLHAAGMAEQVSDLLTTYGLPAGLLTLEITESSVMADPALTQRVLQRLRRRGVRLSIDDFGTGYSSLSHLRRMPVAEVKIAKSFVLDMDANEEDEAIVRSIVELGHTLGLDVVAEGVERARVMQMLGALGCDHAQGYLISRPMPVADFPKWFAARTDPGVRLLHATG
jgi:diguanylate cyclase (GGDEF)-like protein